MVNALWRASRSLKRILVFGDAHIPTRRDSIPPVFYGHIQATKYDLAFVTGDLVRESEMRKAMPPLPKSYIVRGNMDLEGRYNQHEEIQIDGINILLLHGSQVKPRGDLRQLTEIAKHVNADITIHGHTHEEAIDLYECRLFLNPGTISGSTGGWEGRTDASFIELGVSSSHIEVILYHSDWANIRASKAAFTKSAEGISRA